MKDKKPKDYYSLGGYWKSQRYQSMECNCYSTIDESSENRQQPTEPTNHSQRSGKGSSTRVHDVRFYSDNSHCILVNHNRLLARSLLSSEPRR